MDDKLVIAIAIVIICIVSIWLPSSDVPNMAISALAGIATGKLLNNGG